MARRVVARRTFGGRRSPGRLTEWFAASFATSETALAASSFVVVISYTAAALAKRPFTITRTIGSLYVASDQSAAVEFPSGAVGGIIVSDKAIALGATAIPDPVTQGNSDEWFMYQNFAVTGSASNAGGRDLLAFPFDSRAQRKVVDGEDVAFVVSNASAADGLVFFLELRQLIKLS